MNIQEAMKVITTEIANDPGYRIGWEANIAMAFKDAAAQTLVQNEDSRAVTHEIANKAASNFLDILVMPLKINR